MIIVSQDKRKNINFDKVERIEYINNDGQKEFMEKSNLDIFAPIIEKTTGINLKELKDFGIYVYFSNGQAIMIGQYKTEERAKEVSQEIIDKYANWENLKAGQPSGICNPKYEMPLE